MVCVEADAGWAPHFAYRMDHGYKRHRFWMKMGDMAKLPDFDVITELWFENRAGYERMLADHENPEVSGAIARDEENCFDRSKTRFFVVEEAETPG
jgi:hypothetical protein